MKPAPYSNDEGRVLEIYREGMRKATAEGFSKGLQYLAIVMTWVIGSDPSLSMRYLRRIMLNLTERILKEAPEGFDSAFWAKEFAFHAGVYKQAYGVAYTEDKEM